MITKILNERTTPISCPLDIYGEVQFMFNLNNNDKCFVGIVHNKENDVLSVVTKMEDNSGNTISEIITNTNPNHSEGLDIHLSDHYFDKSLQNLFIQELLSKYIGKSAEIDDNFYISAMHFNFTEFKSLSKLKNRDSILIFLGIVSNILENSDYEFNIIPSYNMNKILLYRKDNP